MGLKLWERLLGPIDEHLRQVGCAEGSNVLIVVSGFLQRCPVDDASTMLLMNRFYERHFQDGLEPRKALRDARLWLKSATDAEIAPALSRIVSSSGDVEQTARALARCASAKEQSQKPRFAHPFYWARSKCGALE